MEKKPKKRIFKVIGHDRKEVTTKAGLDVWASTIFNQKMDSYKKGNCGENEALTQGMETLRMYFEFSHNMFETPLFQIRDLQDALNKTSVAKKLKKQDDHFIHGCFVEGLLCLGSNPEQAKNATAEWLGRSETSIENSCKAFKKGSTWSKKNVDDFVGHCGNWIIDLIERTAKPFPDHRKVKKAHAAFKKLYDACKKAQARASTEEFPIYTSRPYERTE